MDFRQIYAVFVFSLSLFAPLAWGAVNGLGSFVSQAHMACAEILVARLSHWKGIQPVNQMRLADALCDDDRIFWPFAQSYAPQLGPELEVRYRTRSSYGPLALGLVGAFERETKEILEALRATIAPLSKNDLEWTGDRFELRVWQRRSDGGLWGGIIHVRVSGETNEDMRHDIGNAENALSLTMAHHLESYLLLVTSSYDVRPYFPLRSTPLRWVRLEVPPSCSERLSFGKRK